MRILKVDHIGIAVDKIEDTAAIFKKLFDIKLTSTHDAPGQPVRVGMLDTEGAVLELIESTDPESSIARFVRKRGPGIHHISLEVDDIGAWVDHLKESGVRLIDEKPRIGAEGLPIVFIHPESTGGILVELKQR